MSDKVCNSEFLGYNEEMDLSYAQYSLYKSCPLKFRYRYIDRLKKKQNEYNTISGNVVGKLFEHFYNDELWRVPKEVQNKLLELLPKKFAEVIARSNVDWDAPKQLSKDELLEDCKKSLLLGLKAVKENLLLGAYAKAEVKVQAKISTHDVIWGRADYLIRRSLKAQPEEILIIDGKNTNSDQYLDESQLLFYSLAYYLANERMVDKVGFLLFKFGTVKWIEFSKEDLKKLREDIHEVIKGIWKKEFEPTYLPGACKFCLYKEECEKETGFAIKQLKTDKSLRVIPDGVTEVGF